MDLGLLDILTAQQVQIERSDASRIANNAGAVNIEGGKKFRDYVSDSAKSARDYLSDRPIKASKKYADERPQNRNVSSAKPEDNENFDQVKSENVSSNDTGKKESSFGEGHNVQGNVTDVQNPENPENNVPSVTQALANLSDEGDIAADAILSLIPDVQDKTDNLQQGVGDILGQAQTADVVVSEDGKVVGATEVAVPLAEGILNLNETQEFSEVHLAKVEAYTLPVNLLGQEVTVTDIAGGVIDVVQADFAQPEIFEADVDLSQAKSLLSKNNGEEENENFSQKTSNIAKDLELQAGVNNFNVKVAEAGVQNVQKNILGVQEVSIKNAEANLDAAKQVVQLNNVNGQNKSVDPDQVQNLQNNNTSNVSSLNSSGGFGGGSENNSQGKSQASFSNTNLTVLDNKNVSGNFIKFQQYVNSSELGGTNLTTNRFAKAEDVLAQIKFGTSNAVGKAEKHVSIQLHPKELGKVDVMMETGNDGKTRVTIMAERADTLNLLQRESESLRNILQDTLKTDSASLSFNFQEKDSQQWKEFLQQAYNGGVGNSADEDNGSEASGGNYPQGFIATDGVDIKV